MKNNYHKKISKISSDAVYRWDAHKFWNKESKKAVHRELKKETLKELDNYYNEKYI